MSRTGRTTQYPKALAAVAIEVTSELMAAGVEEPEALEIGFKAAERVRLRWGGENIYIPKGDVFSRAQRDEKIFQQFDGTNRSEICREHGITEMRFYQIMAAQRAQRKSSNK